MNKKMIQESIIRIQKMEQLFDSLTNQLENFPDALHSLSARKAIQILSDYYSNGDWLHDYELDERHLLPSDLKRGILSQDGLYDFLCDLSE